MLLGSFILSAQNRGREGPSLSGQVSRNERLKVRRFRRLLRWLASATSPFLSSLDVSFGGSPEIESLLVLVESVSRWVFSSKFSLGGSPQIERRIKVHRAKVHRAQEYNAQIRLVLLCDLVLQTN
ncbi:hypothetical protein YC2023_008716 [Brassica napus]